MEGWSCTKPCWLCLLSMRNHLLHMGGGRLCACAVMHGALEKREFQPLHQGSTDLLPKNPCFFGAERARVSSDAAGRKVFIPFVREVLENRISSSLFFILSKFIFHTVFEQQTWAFCLTVMTHLRRPSGKESHECLYVMGDTVPQTALHTSCILRHHRGCKVGKACYYAALFFCLFQSICSSLVSLISIIYGFKDTISCRCRRNRTTNSKLIVPSVFWLKCPFQTGKRDTSPSPCTDSQHD